jgi:hypothetical protein
LPCLPLAALRNDLPPLQDPCLNNQGEIKMFVTKKTLAGVEARLAALEKKQAGQSDAIYKLETEQRYYDSPPFLLTGFLDKTTKPLTVRDVLRAVVRHLGLEVKEEYASVSVVPVKKATRKK